MKKMIKLWDIILVALLGILGTGCNILEPPAAEYGPEPEYGAPYSIGIFDDAQEDISDLSEH